MPFPFDYKSHIKKMFIYFLNTKQKFAVNLCIPRKKVP